MHVSGVFISYRREADGGWAGRLYDVLVAQLGKDAVFQDVQIPPGADFVEQIQHAVGRSAVLLAVIGPTWSDVTDEQGNRRIDDPNDFVRIEIETALARDRVAVMPVLLERAEMPRADAIPPSLAAFGRRQAIRLRSDRWGDDTAALVAAINAHVAADKRDSQEPAADTRSQATLSKPRDEYMVAHAAEENARGEHLEREGDLGRAETAYAAGDRHGHARAATNLGRLMHERGEHTGAAAALHRAFERGDGTAAYYLGLESEGWGSPDGAEAWYRRGHQAGDPVASGAFAGRLLARGERGAAEEVYAEADRRGDGRSAANVGQLLEKRGAVEEAEAAYRRGDERGDERAPLLLGCLLESRGDTDGAVEAYRRAKERGNPYAEEPLKRLKAPLRRWRTALRRPEDR